MILFFIILALLNLIFCYKTSFHLFLLKNVFIFVTVFPSFIYPLVYTFTVTFTLVSNFTININFSKFYSIIYHFYFCVNALSWCVYSYGGFSPLWKSRDTEPFGESFYLRRIPNEIPTLTNI